MLGGTDAALLALVAMLLLATAVYAHRNIPRFTAGRSNVMAAHTILFVVGVAAGAVGALIYRTDPILALLAMLIGFGVVHVPAAIILFLKQERHSGKT